MNPERPAVFAGRFYPGTATSCATAIAEILPGIAPPAASGAIVPHAGWSYSGSTAALSWSAIAAYSPETVIIFGTAHGPDRNAAAAYASGSWRTPLGIVEIDGELADRLACAPFISADPGPHAREHSIEVQIPILQTLLPKAKIVPVVVQPTQRATEVGERCAKAALDSGKRVAFVGSTDLTHYGPAFGFEPHGHGWPGIRWAKDVNDRRVVALLVAMNAEEVLPETALNRNACGPGAIAATLAAMRVLGATHYLELRHTCSAEVEGVADENPLNSVGYEAGIFRPA